MSAKVLSWAIQAFTKSFLRGYFESPYGFEETVARIVTASGQPVQSDDEYKTSVSFEGTFDGQRFTLYDYKEDRTVHIGGNDNLDVAGLQAALTQALAAVEPTPYRASEFYADKRGHGWPAGEEGRS